MTLKSNRKQKRILIDYPDPDYIVNKSSELKELEKRNSKLLMAPDDTDMETLYEQQRLAAFLEEGKLTDE